MFVYHNDPTGQAVRDNAPIGDIVRFSCSVYREGY